MSTLAMMNSPAKALREDSKKSSDVHHNYVESEQRAVRREAEKDWAQRDPTVAGPTTLRRTVTTVERDDGRLIEQSCELMGRRK